MRVLDPAVQPVLVGSPAKAAGSVSGIQPSRSSSAIQACTPTMTSNPSVVTTK